MALVSTIGTSGSTLGAMVLGTPLSNSPATLSILTDIYRGTRRVRILFSGPVGTAAFTSTGYYTVTSTDGAGPSPITVEAVFAIASDPNAVELSIDVDWTPGGLFTVGFIDLPAADGSVFTGAIVNRVGQPVTAPPNVEPETSDLDLILYQEDIAWGQGFFEDPTGDLLTISGRPNWQGAMSRRMISSGLTWDARYGANVQAAIDAPSAFAPALAGQLLDQARQDNRTLQASIDFAQDPLDPNGFAFAMTITGRDDLNPIVLSVPVPPRA